MLDEAQDEDEVMLHPKYEHCCTYDSYEAVKNTSESWGRPKHVPTNVKEAPPDEATFEAPTTAVMVGTGHLTVCAASNADE